MISLFPSSRQPDIRVKTDPLFPANTNVCDKWMVGMKRKGALCITKSSPALMIQYRDQTISLT